MRLFHRLHKAGQAACAGVAFQRTRDHADFTMATFNQVASGDIAALEGVIDHRIGEVGFASPQSITTIGIWRYSSSMLNTESGYSEHITSRPSTRFCAIIDK